MIGSCVACSDTDVVCEKHCEDCGILWQPGFIRVNVELADNDTKTWGLFCPICWENVYVT